MIRWAKKKKITQIKIQTQTNQNQNENQAQPKATKRKNIRNPNPNLVIIQAEHQSKHKRHKAKKKTCRIRFKKKKSYYLYNRALLQYYRTSQSHAATKMLVNQYQPTPGNNSRSWCWRPSSSSPWSAPHTRLSRRHRCHRRIPFRPRRSVARGRPWEAGKTPPESPAPQTGPTSSSSSFLGCRK